MRMIALILAFALGGCGSIEFKGGKSDSSDDSSKDEKAGASAPAHKSLYVAAAAEIPPCVEASEGWLVYVKDEKQFKVCAAGVWENIEIGAPSEPTRIAASISCNGLLEGTVVSVLYNAAVMSNGDIFASASIADGAIQATQSNFYSGSQNGATTAAVLVQYDLQGTPNYGYFRVEVERSTLIAKVTYSDQDFAKEQVWTMDPKKCILNTYEDKPAPES